ncbi:sugar-binding domain-containing protein [Agriterribacter sp.]|uniref:sugar-binding domain-containing protein n=1 Tax=Agriterribacter sp. TaxID=2821509 RepID=UPI002CC8090C|nr:sugar-binding domain-containing protein [Agriterribacter sp.]HRO45740.1 glycoside hydrolase family 2 TIM barrel-domain containing protein [Agriterribacter sp.]HRQ15782.1 glycoside hydrolase family 2 TIM barrel-domain containing protein [Agriterribacter sp.]
MAKRKQIVYLQWQRDNRRVLSILLVIFFLINQSVAQDKISLAGTWRFALDPDSAGYKEKWAATTLPESIQLPGTTDEAGYGIPTTGSDYGILTRAHKYIGPAWYQRTIQIPPSWKGKAVMLYLERVLWESKVYIDGKELSALSPLYVPHIHNLGILSPGNHILTIRINNDLIHDIGDKGHGYTAYTQSIWNGIVGRIELHKVDGLNISAVKTYPDIDKRSLRLETFLQNTSGLQNPLYIKAEVKETETGKLIKTISQKINAKPGEQTINIILEDLKGLQLWDEFTPALYEVNVRLQQGKQTTYWSDKIGFRKITTTRHKILVNDNISYMRCNLDCVHFPLTGYPSCDETEWERIFKIYKSYGLNMVRFHSWCPPEAAFRAADKVGIYIQAEIVWIDWWMTATPENRPEMYTKGLPDGLGKNPDADAFVQAEMKRILDAYGNHPSFVFFCIGNELGNSDFDIMETWIKKAKAEDPRRLYAVSTARKIMPIDDYNATHQIPGIGGTYGNSANKTDAGLEKNYRQATIPIMAHEVGQYPVYPEWSEIDKYKGVLKARNLEGFKKIAEKNGIASQDKDFHKASGALQQLLYKNLIENILLAPSSAGFQLLSMQDYQGQGEALVGWLDAFWDDKKITTPEQFREHSNAVVPLIRTKSFTYTNNDTIALSIELANYYKTALRQPLHWEFINDKGTVIKKGLAKRNQFPQGQLTFADSLLLPCAIFSNEAAQYTFRLFFEDNSYSNSWQFFIYPLHEEITPAGIYVTSQWNNKTDSVLSVGGKVLLLAHEVGTKATSHPVHFFPLFWSSSFFPGQNNATLGLLINEKSAAFKHFPTRYFSNWQWYPISAGAKYFKLSDMPGGFKPLAQPISDFHFNEKLGSIFETKVGNGKLLVCGYNLNQPGNAIANQLYYSLTEYMKSEAFSPAGDLPVDKLKQIVVSVPVAISEAPVSGTFKDASLYVEAGANAGEKSNAWKAKFDKVTIDKGFSYTVNGAGAYKKEGLHGWLGKTMSINIAPPQGVKGYVYLHFINPKRLVHKGTVNVEGREIDTGDIPAEGKWIKILVMREDTNDGKLYIRVTSDNLHPMEIDRMVIMVEE